MNPGTWHVEVGGSVRLNLDIDVQFIWVPTGGYVMFVDSLVPQCGPFSWRVGAQAMTGKIIFDLFHVYR